jgi:hypothetical protein
MRPASLLLLVLGLAMGGCAAADEEDAADTSSDAASALSSAQSDFSQLSAELDRELADRAGSEDRGELHADSLRPLAHGGDTDLCRTLAGVKRRSAALPNLYVFEGASAGAGIVAGISVALERTWDLEHREEAIFTSREESLSASAGVSAGVYAGLGAIDVAYAKSKGDDLAHDVVEGWSGDYFGAAGDIDVPGKFLWASAGCIGDEDGYFLACSLQGGVGASTDLLPIDGEVLMGATHVNVGATELLDRHVGAAHELVRTPYDGAPAVYIRYLPLRVPFLGNRAPNARAALSMIRAMPLAIAVTAGPIALALGVDADLKASRGRSAAELCPAGGD